MDIISAALDSKLLRHPRLRRYRSLVREDLTATYSRDIQKWLVVAPIIGVVTGLVVTGIAITILDVIWNAMLPIYMAHHWMMVVGLLIGFTIAGLIMRYRTPNPNEHSTEEIIRSYHEHRGDIDIQPFWWKLLAAVATVGSGGSCALEGPGIYAGGAIGSWLWTKLKRLRLEPRDRRIMLISGAAAGMAAVFRAPLTGLVFALEMPYKDDLAHEALLPSLISSVVAYSTLISIAGAEPLFGFAATNAPGFQAHDLPWAALLGFGIGLIALVFDITFRRVRTFFIASRIPHPLKLAIGGLGTALCGIAFVSFFDSPLIPIGPNYEAVRYILSHRMPAHVLLAFAGFKLAATICSLGVGGVSAMFVPLLLSGAAIGRAYAFAVVGGPQFGLYAAVGMAAFIAAGYKAPLTAVVFVAEAAGGHAFLIPSLIGAAVAYAVSGEASVSGDQHLHEAARLAELSGRTVRDVMQQQVVSVSAAATLREFAAAVAANQRHTIYPVADAGGIGGTISASDLGRVPPEKWDTVTAGETANRDAVCVDTDCDLGEALRLLVRERGAQMLLVVDDTGKLAGIVTKTDILRGVNIGGPAPNSDQ
ncbi:MAG TPA: chloride channel protein [Candidatus Binataceae bacterium]|nr:chloride channel protein [Candidatus Binataceae bacterium]